MSVVSLNQVTELSITINNVPGTLAKVATALADAGVNLEGISQVTETEAEMGGIRFVTSQVDLAKQVLESLGLKYSEEKILAVLSSDKPGILAQIARTLRSAKVNIENLYVSTPGDAKDTIMFIEVHSEDLAKATKALQPLTS